VKLMVIEEEESAAYGKMAVRSALWRRQYDKEMLLRTAMVLQEICIKGLISNHVKIKGRMLELIWTCVVYMCVSAHCVDSR
jgi:hypothetical protein